MKWEELRSLGYPSPCMLQGARPARISWQGSKSEGSCVVCVRERVPIQIINQVSLSQMIHHNVKVGQSNFTFQILYSPACPYSGSSLQSGELNSVTGLKVGCHLWYARLRQEKNERPRAEIKIHVFKSNLALHARSHQRNNTRIFSVAAMCICIFMHKLLIRCINY